MLQEDNSVIPDQYIQWRHKTRNLNFKNQIPAVPEILQNINSPANTVQGKTGYYWWGGGFNISAHKNGCFSYNFNNQTYSFDMSLFDIGADPNSGDWNE